MIGAFRAFAGELERKWPHLYAEGEFDDVVDMLSDLSNETTSAGIRLSDMAVELARGPESLIGRMYYLEKLSEDLKKFGSPEAVCAARLP